MHPLISVPFALLLVTYLFIPKLIFGALGADRRLLLAIVLVGLAGLEWRIESRRMKLALVSLCLVVFFGRMIVVGVNWRDSAKVYSGIMEAIDKIEPGSRVAFLAGDEFNPNLRNPPLDNVGNMAVARKDVFMNSLFARPEHQILQVNYNTDTEFFRAPSQQFRRERTTDSFDPFAQLPWERFDYLLLVNPQMFADSYLSHTARLYQAPHVALFKILPAETAKGAVESDLLPAGPRPSN